MLLRIISKTTPANTRLGITRIQSDMINRSSTLGSWSSLICSGIWIKKEESHVIIAHTSPTHTSDLGTTVGLCHN